MSPNTSSAVAAQPKSAAQLSCQTCHRKKIKCDRSYPCGQCINSGSVCNPSTRKPRARNVVKNDTELRRRIAKLEQLVEKLERHGGENGGDGPPPVIPQSQVNIAGVSSVSSAAADAEPEELQSQSIRHNTFSPDGSDYATGTFWSSLTSEVRALANALDEDDLQGDTESATPETISGSDGSNASNGPTNGAHNYELILCQPGALYVTLGALNEPDSKMASCLLDSYLTHVESIQKLLHVPTLRAFMDRERPYNNKGKDAPCNKALKAAIYFSGITACNEQESLDMLNRSRDKLAQELKVMAEVALYRANLLNSTDLATLQAFTIYIGAIRVLDPSQRAWSMIALLVRLARNLGIHRELSGETVFIAELRRRLWYSIVLLDCYASSDRGTEMAIHPHTFDRHLPHNTNDNDFDENTKAIVDREGEITECTMSLITQEGSVAALQLFHDEISPSEGKTWEERLEIAYTFQRIINEKYLHYCDQQNPFHRQLTAAGTAAAKGIILRAIRPIQHSPSSIPSPRVDSPWVMQLAVEILRQQHELWEMFLQSRGRRMPWVPWHAMAVALAGICSMEPGNPLMNEAWDLCEKAMGRYRNDIADTSNGMLWRPIEKIYKKAKAHRQQSGLVGLQQSSDMAWSADRNDLAGVTIEYSSMLDLQGVSDESWLDWEAMLKDMDEMKACDMLWM